MAAATPSSTSPPPSHPVPVPVHVPVPVPVPPYILDPLLFPALPPDDPATSPDPNSPAGLKRAQSKAVRCTEADADNLYIGTSDGLLHIYSVSYPAQSTSRASKPRYRLRTTRTISSSSKPVEKIILLPSFSLLGILCEGLLSFYSLSDWTTAPNLPSTRAVSTVVLDDDEVENSGGLDGMGMVSLCIVRRKNILLTKLGRHSNGELVWHVIKDIPLPGGATTARRYADTLCIATVSEYSLVNLSSGQITPLGLAISQTGESPSAQVRPSIITIPTQEATPSDSNSAPNPSSTAKSEFLITSHTGSITLGVFVKASGEPSPKLLEWPSHPRSLIFTSSYLFSLLRNDTIEVHDVRSDVMQKVDTHHLPPGSEPRFLASMPKSSWSPSTHLSASEASMNDLDTVKLQLDSPRNSRLLGRHPSSDRHGQFDVLLCGRNSIQSLAQESILDWGLSLLRKGHLATLESDLEALEQRQSQSVSRNRTSDSLSELELLYQAMAVEHLHRARFWEAAQLLCKGSADPRLVNSLFSSTDELDAEPDAAVRSKREAVIPAALQDVIVSKLSSPEAGLKHSGQLIQENLTLNYCPPLDVNSDPVLHQLASTLGHRAKDMQLSVLKHWRQGSAAHRAGSTEGTLRWAGKLMDEQMRASVDHEVDSTLVHVLATSDPDDEQAERDLDELLGSDNACSPEQVERVLRQRQDWVALAKMYEKKERWADVLDIWTAVIDGQLSDARRGNTAVSVTQVAELVSELDDPSLLSKYGTWLVKKDSNAGVGILTKKTQLSLVSANGQSKSTKEQELAAVEGQRSTIAELTSIDTKAADEFLEISVLSATKIQDKAMHTQLFDMLMSRVESQLADPSNRERMRAVALEYAAGWFAESFFAHLALAAAQVPEDVNRLKLAMLLQGSTVLDYASVRSRIEQDSLLAYERAIVLGKIGADKEALELLALELRDANSSEAYCSQNGEVLTPMIAQSVAEDHGGLKAYAAMVSRTHAQRRRISSKMALQNPSERRERKAALLKTLLTVYMEKGHDETFRTATAHLLNTQALHLDAVDILQLVPDEWPLSTLETFLSQSLRRQMHRRAEVEINKAVSLCRSLDVAEDVWARLRAMGGVIQDAEDESGIPPPPPRPAKEEVAGYEKKLLIDGHDGADDLYDAHEIRVGVQDEKADDQGGAAAGTGTGTGAGTETAM